MIEDRFTNTVEDAARYERSRGDAYDDDRPTRAEAEQDGPSPRHVEVPVTAADFAPRTHG